MRMKQKLCWRTYWEARRKKCLQLKFKAKMDYIEKNFGNLTRKWQNLKGINNTQKVKKVPI